MFYYYYEFVFDMISQATSLVSICILPGKMKEEHQGCGKHWLFVYLL